MRDTKVREEHQNHPHDRQDNNSSKKNGTTRDGFAMRFHLRVGYRILRVAGLVPSEELRRLHLWLGISKRLEVYGYTSKIINFFSQRSMAVIERDLNEQS